MNAKITILLLLVSASIFWGYTSFHNQKDSSIDSLRAQVEESKAREQEAAKARMEREDSFSRALYLECFSRSTSNTGSRFDEQQREAYDCWKSELTKTNGTGNLAPASEPPSRPITSNKQAYDSHNDASKIRPDSQRTSGTGSKIQPATKTPRDGLATTVQSRGTIQVASAVNKGGSPVQKGTNSDYWLAYETAVKLIRKFEGLQLKSYWDISHCSIGYGFSYPCGKTITRATADKMLSDRINSELSIVRSDFTKLNANAQGALVSFKHNCPAGYQSVRKNGLKWFNSWCRTADGERKQGLVNRRVEEWKIISSK